MLTKPILVIAQLQSQIANYKRYYTGEDEWQFFMVEAQLTSNVKNDVDLKTV